MSALEHTEAEYPADERMTLCEAPGLRVRRLSLAAGQCVPWHLHTTITDTFFCMEGPMRIATRDPEGEHVLQAGGTLAVAPGTAHYVAGVDDGPCRFMLVQGVGEYDYVAVEA